MGHAPGARVGHARAEPPALASEVDPEDRADQEEEGEGRRAAEASGTDLVAALPGDVPAALRGVAVPRPGAGVAAGAGARAKSWSLSIPRRRTCRPRHRSPKVR